MTVKEAISALQEVPPDSWVTPFHVINTQQPISMLTVEQWNAVCGYGLVSEDTSYMTLERYKELCAEDYAAEVLKSSDLPEEDDSIE